MTSPHQNSSNKWMSPSNVTIAILVGFLFVGHASDWRMLHGRPSRSERTAATYPPARTARCPLQHNQPAAARLNEAKTNPKSVVADNRPAPHDGKSRQEID